MPKLTAKDLLPPPAPEPPVDLSASSQALWKSLMGRQRRWSAGRLELLTQALRARDRLQQIEETLRAEGLVSVTKKTGMTHVNPLMKLEVELRRQLSSIWQVLGLQWQGD